MFSMSLSALVLVAQAASEPAGLNAWGWTIMLVSVGSVVSLTVCCMARVLARPPVEVEELSSPVDIDTGDTEDADELDNLDAQVSVKLAYGRGKYFSTTSKNSAGDLMVATYLRKSRAPGRPWA